VSNESRRAWAILVRRLATQTLRLLLGGWPLPAAGGQPGHCTPARPNRFSAVGSENTWKLPTEAFRYPQNLGKPSIIVAGAW